MTSKKVSWRDRMPEEITCVRCLEELPKEELDRLLWCEECLARAGRRANLVGWVSGAIIAGLLALWIWLVIQPDLSLIPALWGATLAVAFYLGGRVSREIAFGVMRVRNRRAVEARPPAAPDGEATAGSD